jgi:hypothetical protein
MGTRNLTIVKFDGLTRLSKYGNSDGYLTGLGFELATFIKHAGAKRIRELMSKVRFASEDDLLLQSTPDWHEKYPWLSYRLHGAELLRYLDEYEGDEILPVQDDEQFAADSLFCEWCYVIDLDQETFEIYKGNNTTPLTEQDRFFFLDSDCGVEDHHPVKLVRSYNFDELNPDDLISLQEMLRKLDMA